MLDEKIVGSLEITKTDVATGELIPNCGFEILDADMNVIVQGYTDENGKATFPELEYGDYFYREFDAPAGYLIDEEAYPFAIREHHEVVKAEMTNQKIIDELLEDDNLTFEDCEVINYDDLMEQVEAVAEKEIQQAQASVDVSEMDSAEPDIEKKEPTISFYVAECGEFHNMGEYHEGIETLEEAIALYDQIPSERMNGVKSIGFVLHDDSIYDDMDCDLMQGNRVLSDVVNDIGHYRESSLVQNALSQLQSIMDERSAIKEAAQAKPGIVPLSPLTFEEARQQGKVDSWRASRRETEACAHEFQKDFSMAYHERRMPEYLQQWVDKYGMERCKIVLASTIQLADHDGRYYPSTKESAARVVIPGANAEDYSRDIRFSYAVNTHPVMVNGAFRELLNMEQERGKDKSQTVMQDAKAPKASVLSRLHDKQKQVSNTKQNPAKGQDKKRGVELGFLLRRRSEKFQNQFTLRIVAVQPFLFKVDRHPMLFQKLQILLAVDGVSGKPADGLHHHKVHLAIGTIRNQSLELRSLFSVESGEALVAVNPHKLHVLSASDQVLVVGALGFIGKFLFLHQCAHTAIGRNPSRL